MMCVGLHAPVGRQVTSREEGTWEPDPPNVDQAEKAMLAIAAREDDETPAAVWLKGHLRFVDRG